MVPFGNGGFVRLVKSNPLL